MPCRIRVPPSYTAYGFRSHPVASLAFHGEYLDPFTQYYPLGAGRRIYNPKLMRFLSLDALSPFGAGGLNAYAYVRGDPVNFSDPDGHAPVRGNGPRFNYEGPVQVIEGMHVFHTKSPSGEPVVNISAHGALGRLQTDQGTIRAAAVVATLEKNGVEVAGVQTHVLSCYSANRLPGNRPSFIQELADLSQAPSSGYLEKVWVRSNRHNIKAGKTKTLQVEILKRMGEDHPKYKSFAYHPVTVEPSNSIAKSSVNQEARIIRTDEQAPRSLKNSLSNFRKRRLHSTSSLSGN